MARLSIAILLTLVCWATAQVNYRCSRTPSAWMADRFFIDYDTRRSAFSEIYYSATQESVYERVYRRDEGSRPTQYEEWLDFRTQTKYNRTFGEECRSYTFSFPFQPFRVPTDAEFRGRSTFGGSLPVDLFSGEFDEGTGRYFLYWSPISPVGDYECIPVIEAFIKEGPTTPFSERRNIHITYTNVTTAFENPPEHCVPAAQRQERLIL